MSTRFNSVYTQGCRESFILTDVEDESKISTVEIEARYVPVPVKLEPRESINSTLLHVAAGIPLTMHPDQGVLRVDVIEGRDLMAADRGGMTLPYTILLTVDMLYKVNPTRSQCSPSMGKRCLGHRQRRRLCTPIGRKTLPPVW